MSVEVLSDEEVDAIEALTRAAIRWTAAGDGALVMEKFDLLMADYKRLRQYEKSGT